MVLALLSLPWANQFLWITVVVTVISGVAYFLKPGCFKRFDEIICYNVDAGEFPAGIDFCCYSDKHKL